MKDSMEKHYLEKEAVAVDLTEERFRFLRAAYLEERITVNGQRLAEKLLSFESSLDAALKAAENTQKKSNLR
ncbi:hypothetical protein [Candidatus Sororendozoicomonas aggregata]|uniref:hypothetical protein n=1 Tax=Candidatus Sororendozoicomonas aggregata TaxID=3073239 RepID=UPI002ED1B522